MTERTPGDRAPADDCARELARLRKIVRVLMDRAERSAGSLDSEFNLFQSTIMLEDQVRRRTAELETALRENEKINRALRASEAKFRGLVSQSMVGIVIVENRKFSYSNAKFDEMFGYTAAEMRELGPLDIASVDEHPFIAENLRARISGEVDRVVYTFHGRRRDGELIDVEVHGCAMDVGGERLLISLVMDITERARAERELKTLQERLREQSTHDALTGLHNRRHLEEALDLALSASFGIATFPQHGASADLLIAAADEALYAAKKAGRNCIRVSGANGVGHSARRTGASAVGTARTARVVRQHQ